MQKDRKQMMMVVVSQDFAGSGQNRVTVKKQVRAGSSHTAVRNIAVAKFN